MVWFNVDDGLTTNPKVLSIPRSERLRVIGLWTMAGSWCGQHLTDGLVPAFMLEEWGADEALAQHLVDVGMWRRTSKGYLFNAWDEYQRSRAEIEEKRDAERKRKQAYRDRRAGQAGNGPTGTPNGTDGGTPAGQDAGHQEASAPPSQAIPSHSLPSHTDPINSSSSAEEGAKRRKREVRLPKDWAPTASHIERAREKGVNVVAEAEAFRLHAETHDRHAANWNSAFTTWLMKARPSAEVVHLAPKLSEKEQEQRAWLSARGVAWEEYLERRDEPGWLDGLKRQGPRHG